jgi:hypothetical protein
VCHQARYDFTANNQKRQILSSRQTSSQVSHPTELAVILVIMSVSTFKIDVIRYVHIFLFFITFLPLKYSEVDSSC